MYFGLKFIVISLFNIEMKIRFFYTINSIDITMFSDMEIVLLIIYALVLMILIFYDKLNIFLFLEIMLCNIFLDAHCISAQVEGSNYISNEICLEFKLHINSSGGTDARLHRSAGAAHGGCQVSLI